MSSDDTDDTPGYWETLEATGRLFAEMVALGHYPEADALLDEYFSPTE